MSGKVKDCVYILGRPDLEKELIRYVVLGELGVSCDILETVQDLELIHAGTRRLFLVDAADQRMDEYLLDLRYHSGDDGEGRCIVALYNMETGQSAENEAMMRGVRGFFYSGDEMKVLIKGLQAMLDGEIWLSREILVNMVLQRNDQSGAVEDAAPKLTRRETEILAHVGVGRTNDEIADRLSISTHTVKTHLYRVFRKIGVDNRFQAALWAAKHG